MLPVADTNESAAKLFWMCMTSEVKQATIIVFARAPRPGQCKTRLIPAYGKLGAARIYRQLARRTITAAAGSRVGPIQLWASDGKGHPFLWQLARDFGLSRRVQPTGDLGHRMSYAIDQVLASGAPAALLVGTDAINLDADDFCRAAEALISAEADAVLQPAYDGGYVMIGARKPLGSSLKGTDWSSGKELGQTEIKLIKQGFKTLLMESRLDIDEPADMAAAKRAGIWPVSV